MQPDIHSDYTRPSLPRSLHRRSLHIRSVQNISDDSSTNDKLKLIKFINTLNVKIDMLKTTIKILQQYKDNITLIGEVLFENKDDIPDGIYLKLMNALIGKQLS